MKKRQPDYLFISIIVIIVLFGLVVLFSASMIPSQDVFGQGHYFLKHQLFYGVLPGLFLFFIFQRFYYKHWQKIIFPLMIFGIVLLCLVFIPEVGHSHGGAKRWIKLGGFSLQPFEFVKLIFVVYLSALLSKKGKSEQVIKESLLPFLVIAGIVSFLVLCQPNVSALMIFFLIAGIVYFLAEAKILHIMALIGVGLAGLVAFIKTTGYNISRLTVYLHPEIDPQGVGYQINQALLAIGSGGLFGLGLSHSIQKYHYLPEIIGDSIFAIIAEELGLLGAGVLIILFIAFAWRGFKIAKRASDKFGYLLAGSITAWLVFQAFINITSISGLIPITGVPLPFIGYGGSAMAVSLAAVGILVNISKYSK
ncbi:MAG: putative lipid II flippase FtsW [Patescibacteria group bacterium]|nr:putative lipid II flippase FtsW [Patescibacteria group bacterium]